MLFCHAIERLYFSLIMPLCLQYLYCCQRIDDTLAFGRLSKIRNIIVILLKILTSFDNMFYKQLYSDELDF